MRIVDTFETKIPKDKIIYDLFSDDEINDAIERARDQIKDYTGVFAVDYVGAPFRPREYVYSNIEQVLEKLREAFEFTNRWETWALTESGIVDCKTNSRAIQVPNIEVFYKKDMTSLEQLILTMADLVGIERVSRVSFAPRYSEVYLNKQK